MGQETSTPQTGAAPTTPQTGAAPTTPQTGAAPTTPQTGQEAPIYQIREASTNKTGQKAPTTPQTGQEAPIYQIRESPTTQTGQKAPIYQITTQTGQEAPTDQILYLKIKKTYNENEFPLLLGVNRLSAGFDIKPTIVEISAELSKIIKMDKDGIQKGLINSCNNNLKSGKWNTALITAYSGLQSKLTDAKSLQFIFDKNRRYNIPTFLECLSDMMFLITNKRFTRYINNP